MTNSFPSESIKTELGNLSDLAARYFRGDSDKTAAFIVDYSIPFYLAASGHKMYRYDEVWAAINETKWQEHNKV